jgi:hypothetical protein
MFNKPLSSNGRLCGTSLTAHFRRSGVMSQYNTLAGVQHSTLDTFAGYIPTENSSAKSQTIIKKAHSFVTSRDS